MNESRELVLAKLYKQIIQGVATDQQFIQVIAHLVYQTVQTIIFQSANKNGYDMDLLKKLLDEQLKEFMDSQTEIEEENQ